MADVTPILIKDLAAQTTLADTDYFIVGGADAKKITVAQMKEALGINELNTNLFDLQNTTDKMGVYDVWANDSIAFNVVFRVPVNGGQNRPVFLMMGNIGTNSFMMICTTSSLGDVLSPATCIDIIGNMSSQMTVNINRHENSADQLRINFTTPTNMGARVQVIVPAGRIVNQW